jgi:bile acid:Na+ symporter, BASS family
MRGTVARTQLSALQVVLAPVCLGVFINQKFPSTVAKVAPYTPVVAVVMVAATCACVMAQTSAAVRQAGPAIFLAIIALHVGGFTLGYLASKLLGVDEKASRTNSIEVGMQNSTLGASLAMLHFPDPLTAVPCVLSACIHSMVGSAIAGFWRMQDERVASRPSSV